MNRINAKTLERLYDTAQTCSNLYAELEAAKAEFEEKAALILEQFAEAQEEARGLMDDEALAAEEYFDERSEKWQEGERGERYAEWRDRLRQLADEIAEEVEAPDVALADEPEWIGQLKEPSDFEAVPD